MVHGNGSISLLARPALHHVAGLKLGEINGELVMTRIAKKDPHVGISISIDLQPVFVLVPLPERLTDLIRPHLRSPLHDCRNGMA